MGSDDDFVEKPSPSKQKAADGDDFKIPKISQQEDTSDFKPPATGAKLEEDNSSDDDKPLGRQAPAVKKEDSGSDSDAPLVKRASRPKASKAPAKRPKLESDSDDEKPLVAVKKKLKSETNGKGAASAVKTETKPVKLKQPKKPEDPEIFDWWNKEEHKDGTKWVTLNHNGVIFPPPYKPHGLKMLYEGKPVDLPAPAEEVATLYAAMINTDYAQKDVFNKNFFRDFTRILNKCRKKLGLEKSHITQFSKCDFSRIVAYCEEQKELKKKMTPEEKLKVKTEKMEIDAKYGIAMVDGHKEKVGNFRVEPPGLFRGRGDHPKMGTLKKRVKPEQVTINIGNRKDAPEPPPGRKWKEIVSNNKVTWLAYWKDNVNDETKYVWLAASSSFRGRSDLEKFEKARELHKHIGKIRKTYTQQLKSSDQTERQSATALWLIDHLALRVGNEKGEDEADTVGVCSLRVEHSELIEPSTLKLDFLGKDSIRYLNEVEVDPQVFHNLKMFRKNSKPSDELFDRVSTSSLNAQLKAFMNGLTAKVFRTYNASKTLQDELDKLDENDELTVGEKVLFYNRANREVAILCNHQKAPPKNFNDQMSKLNDKKEEIELHIREIESFIKANQKEDECKKLKKKFINSEDPKSESRVTSLSKLNKEKLKARKIVVNRRLEAVELQMKTKDDLKSVALGTSKINYLDPRISAGWCKKHEVPVEKIFNRSLLQKFPWAMDVQSNWSFH